MLYRNLNDQDFAGVQRIDLEAAQHHHPDWHTKPEREQQRLLRSSTAALRFFARSEHSFVAVNDEQHTMYGFVLAQSVWQGDQPIVWISSLTTSSDAPEETLPGLLHACVKSAYDTAVYEVHWAVAQNYLAYAEREGFTITETRHSVCYLGSLKAKVIREGEF
jgi:hypothetical protein